MEAPRQKKFLEVDGRKLISLQDFEKAACPYGTEYLSPNGLKCGEGILPKSVNGYYSGGAGDEITLKRNQSAFSSIFLKPRCLRDVSFVNTSTTLLSSHHPGGLKVSIPVGIAPSAFQRLCHSTGELGTAQAAKDCRTCMCLSTLSTTSLEKVAQHNGDGIRMFQLYVFKDREITRTLLRRAEAAGYKAIVLTIDAPAGIGGRETDIRTSFSLPTHLSLANLTDTPHLRKMNNSSGGSALETFSKREFDSTLTWDAITWLKTQTHLPIIVKGIMCAEDGILAAEAGVAAVWVSNHGARQLDTVESSIEALPSIVSSLKGTGVEVYFDGGVRRGTDVLKALAMGANFVFIGRPVLWGLAVAGAEGVSLILEQLTKELLSAMESCGVIDVRDISPDSLIIKEPTHSPPRHISKF